MKPSCSPLLLAALAVLASWQFVRNVESAEIVLHRHASIDGDVVRLADVATVSDADPLTVDSMGQVILGPAPQRESAVTVALIQDRLRASSLLTADTTLTGATKCHLKRTVSAEPVVQQVAYVSSDELARATSRLASAVENRLSKAFPLDGPFAVSVTLDRMDAAVVAGLPDPLMFHGGSADLTAPQQLTLSADRPISFTANITRVERGVVAAVSLRPGTVLQASHLTLAPLEEPGLLDTSLAVGQEVRRPISAGQPVHSTDLRKVMLVQSNQAVMVQAEYPGIVVRRVMKSLDSGAIGEVVTCVSLDGDKKVAAIVTGPNMARVAKSVSPVTPESIAGVRFEVPNTATSNATTPSTGGQ